MRNPYQFMFFYIHRSFTLVEDKYPVSSTSFVLAILALFTFLGLTMILEVILGIEIIKKIGMLMFVLVYILLVFFNLIYYSANHNYKSILEKFSNLRSDQHSKNWRYTLLIMILIVVFMLVSGGIKANYF